MRLGIFGGSFDPPHLGHLILSAEALDQLKLDRLIWVPAAVPPHKNQAALSSLDTRLKMVEAAIADNPDFVLSRVDIERPGPQYTVDTLRILKEKHPNDALILMLGGDSLHDLPTWYCPHELLELCESLGVMRRPGDRVDLEEIEKNLPGVTQKVAWIDAPLLEISSNQIRQRIAQNHTFRYYLPEAVYDIIQNEQLYRKIGGWNPPDSGVDVFRRDVVS